MSKNSHIKYSPFHNHDRLITACAAARYYKVDGVGNESYLSMVVALLKITGGTHYHFGMIPEEKQQVLSQLLIEHGIQSCQFINIPWSDSLAESMLEHNIDVFLEPFPTISYKITLEAMSVGIPVMIRNGYTRMNTVDFVPKNCLTWNTREVFLNTLSTICAETLWMQSELVTQYYLTNHDIQTIKPFFLSEKPFPIGDFSECTDDSLRPISEYSFLYQSFENPDLGSQRSIDALNLEPKSAGSAGIFRKIRMYWKTEGFSGVIVRAFRKAVSLLKSC